MLLTVSSATPRATVQQQTSASRPRPLSDTRADDGTDRWKTFEFLAAAKSSGTTPPGHSPEQTPENDFLLTRRETALPIPPSTCPLPAPGVAPQNCEGGTGKTSAMLAAYCHLSRRPTKRGATPVLPIFIALPQLSDVHDSGALDRRVWEQLGAASRSEAEFVARRATIVILLDSLDECNILPERRGRALIAPPSRTSRWPCLS